MGQAGSQAANAPCSRTRTRTLPHEPRRLAPKVLPSLSGTPRLRTTDNGAILQSGGTISGRRPSTGVFETSCVHPNTNGNPHRARSASGSGEFACRERDPLHRSHTNLDIRYPNCNNPNKRFGSEPDLRVEEECQKPKVNKHYRKKYRAPPPPSKITYEDSSPDSSIGNQKLEPHKKARLFKTKNESKFINGYRESDLLHQKGGYRSLDYIENHAFELRYKSNYSKYQLRNQDNSDMIQSVVSLKREENLIQEEIRNNRKSKIDQTKGCRSKSSKSNVNNEAWKTPLSNRDFRHSERFKESFEPTPLRREKTFDETLLNSDRDSEPIRPSNNRIKQPAQQSKLNRLRTLAEIERPMRKSLPSLLIKNSEGKDEFQRELKKATSKIRCDIGNKSSVGQNKTSQIDYKRSSTKTPITNEVKKPSLNAHKTDIYLNISDTKISKSKGNFNQNGTKISSNSNPKSNIPIAKSSNVKEKKEIRKIERPILRPIADRGQASGKESTPEHSPERNPRRNIEYSNKKNQAPHKQFYFGMDKTKGSKMESNLKNFPGLGSPIIQELTDFRAIERKLLGYNEEDQDFDASNVIIKSNCKKNLSSESALSSEGSEAEISESSLGVKLRLRPTLPKKQTAPPRFSPTAAWRQLACLDAYLASESRPLAVETKIGPEIKEESSPRSDKSGDKSGDSGISGDHTHSDHRLDSPTGMFPNGKPVTWTPQQDLGDSSSDGAGGNVSLHQTLGAGLANYSPCSQPFSLSLPREQQEKGKPLQQGYNSLQKLKKSVSGALGAALGSRRFDLEHEPMLEEGEQNWFLTKSAPNSLTNPMLFQHQIRANGSAGLGEDIKEETEPTLEKEEVNVWKRSAPLQLGGHVMYLPPAPTVPGVVGTTEGPDQPHSLIAAFERPIRSKSSGCLEAGARAARAARDSLSKEMRERDRSASPPTAAAARALPARVLSLGDRAGKRTNGKKFTFQSTVRQAERRRVADKLARDAALREQRRKTELEAMRRVEEEFQRKRAREKANIRQQLRLVSGTAHYVGDRDEPDGLCRYSPLPAPDRHKSGRHSNASSELSGRSKSTTPVRSLEGGEWRESGPRVYRDWTSAAPAPAPHAAHDHPPACARIPKAAPQIFAPVETEAFSGSPRSDNYRMEFARGRSPLTPRAPRLIPAARTSTSSSGSELSLRQPIKIREVKNEEMKAPSLVAALTSPQQQPRTSLVIH